MQKERKSKSSRSSNQLPDHVEQIDRLTKVLGSESAISRLRGPTKASKTILSKNSERSVMIHVSNVTKRYGNKILYSEASFQVRPGDKIGLVGPNGAGKTTIFRILMKQEGVESGHIAIGEKIRIG